MTTPPKSTKRATPPAAATSAAARPPARRVALLGAALVAVAGGAAFATYGTTYGPAAVDAPPAPAAAAPNAAPSAPPAAAPNTVPNAAPNTVPNTTAPNTASNAAPNITPNVASAAAAKRPRAARDSAPAAPDTVVIEREVYGYGGGNRRDPFRPLIVTTVLRPFPSELKLVAVAYDPGGRNSVAILRDITTKAQHRVRAGQLVGRMRVVRIDPKAVVFVVEELGFSRRETLTLQDSLGTRQP